MKPVLNTTTAYRLKGNLDFHYNSEQGRYTILGLDGYLTSEEYELFNESDIPYKLYYESDLHKNTEHTLIDNINMPNSWFEEVNISKEGTVWDFSLCKDIIIFSILKVTHSQLASLLLEARDFGYSLIHTDYKTIIHLEKKHFL